MIAFEVPLEQIPAGTAQMKRTNHRTGAFFEADSVKAARQLYTYLVRRFAPKEPLTGCVDVSVTFAYNTKDSKKRGHWKGTRPDCDNVVKLYIDVLADCGFFKEDAQVAKLCISKVYSERDHAYIRTVIQKLED